MRSQQGPAHGVKGEGGPAQLKPARARECVARRWLQSGEAAARWWKPNSGGNNSSPGPVPGQTARGG
jgi:hypothetical protein